MFENPCPCCYSTLDIHEHGCEYESVDRFRIEKAYLDIISFLSMISVTKKTLEANTENWSPLHEDCLDVLQQTYRVSQYTDGRYKLLSKEERKRTVTPTFEPLNTIYQNGTVPGCHDNGIFALVAYYANQDLSWEQTKQKLKEWFERTGTWDTGGFNSHGSIDDVLADKKHVWEKEYGWKTHGEAAKRVIEQYKSNQPGAADSAQAQSSPAVDSGTGESASS